MSPCRTLCVFKPLGKIIHQADIPQKRAAKVLIADIARTDKGVGHVLPGNADGLRRKGHACRLKNGAQPTDTARVLLKKSGVIEG